jgi:hypothetical protein
VVNLVLFALQLGLVLPLLLMMTMTGFLALNERFPLMGFFSQHHVHLFLPSFWLVHPWNHRLL